MSGLWYTRATMRQLVHFVPGEALDDDEFAARLRWPMPRGVTRAYVEAYTNPGDIVLVPYCQGPAEVQEILAAGRRALAVNYDPLSVLIVRNSLLALRARDLDAAVARLGDSLKQGIPLRQMLTQLYATACPACQRQAVAEWFMWERDDNQPITKQVRCRECGWDGEASVDAEDLERLAAIPDRGLHTYYILERLASVAGDEAPPARVEGLLKLYSPRNLYALAELTLKIESLFASDPERTALQALLLDCLDRCSGLTPVPGTAARRRYLARPSRYLERNVWLAFEEAAARRHEPREDSVPAQAATLAQLLAAKDSASDAKAVAYVGQVLVRELRQVLPPRSLHLIIFSPPPMEPEAWWLAWFWAAWLLGREAAAPLRALLHHRAPDEAWYAGVMAGSLRALAEALCDDGHLVIALTGQRPSVAEALVTGSVRARLGLAAFAQSGSDYRLDLVPGQAEAAVPPGRIATLGYPNLEDQVRRAAVEAATKVIRARGEPVSWLVLHAAVLRRLVEEGLLSRAMQVVQGMAGVEALIEEQMAAALEDPALVRLEVGDEPMWWVSDARNMAAPLSDRVEQAAYEVISEAGRLARGEFARAVYGQFGLDEVPEEALVQACLASYGAETESGTWHLRTEDVRQRREEERQAMVGQLLSLGRRLGYQCGAWSAFDAAWFKAGQVRSAFLVRWQAAAGGLPELGQQAPGVALYLVIPGGRSALLSYKLAHNPVLRRGIEDTGWRFIKYRHIRELAAQSDVDEYSLRTIVGLDPIVEQEAVQLSLF